MQPEKLSVFLGADQTIQFAQTEFDVLQTNKFLLKTDMNN